MDCLFFDPNNVGRCNHIANVSYNIFKSQRKTHWSKIVLDSIEKANELDFLILQFNAVVEDNLSARHLYEKLGFKQFGVIPKGFYKQIWKSVGGSVDVDIISCGERFIWKNIWSDRKC